MGGPNQLMVVGGPIASKGMYVPFRPNSAISRDAELSPNPLPSFPDPAFLLVPPTHSPFTTSVEYSSRIPNSDKYSLHVNDHTQAFSIGTGWAQMRLWITTKRCKAFRWLSKLVSTSIAHTALQPEHWLSGDDKGHEHLSQDHVFLPSSGYGRRQTVCVRALLCVRACLHVCVCVFWWVTCR